MEDWRSALANRDLDKLIEHYSPDVLFFDVIPTLSAPRHSGLPS